MRYSQGGRGDKKHLWAERKPEPKPTKKYGVTYVDTKVLRTFLRVKETLQKDGSTTYELVEQYVCPHTGCGAKFLTRLAIEPECPQCELPLHTDSVFVLEKERTLDHLVHFSWTQH